MKSSGIVESWIGISLDEFKRMKDSDVQYIKHRGPLCELKMTRWDCIRWLEIKGLEIPQRSSCVFCPYHNKAAWAEMKSNQKDWQQAIDLDNRIRKMRPPLDLFVHQDRIPLAEVDLRSPQEMGQIDMFENECNGVCGI